MSPAKPLGPVASIGPIREIDRELETLLARLTDEEWDAVAVKDWRVRDVAAHLLDTSLRRLSLDRDGHIPTGSPPPPSSNDFSSWVSFLDGLNADWTRAAERLSPRVILELLRLTNPQVADYFESLDPEAPATFGVRWAEESDSWVWLDVAREYTEKWHHQQQIRDAVGRPGLDAPHLLIPLIETLLRSLPLAYDAVEAESGTTVAIAATEIEDGEWLLRRDAGGWGLYERDSTVEPAAAIRMPGAALWRLLMKQIPREDARAEAQTSGPAELVEPLFRAVAVMA